jgi:hypothetical protein
MSCGVSPWEIARDEHISLSKDELRRGNLEEGTVIGLPVHGEKCGVNYPPTRGDVDMPY